MRSVMPNDATGPKLDAEPPAKSAARIGSELRAVREGLGWKLTDVAAGLRIRLPYLEAIERGELSVLPGAAYQTGFVRSYAQALGLDPDEILRRFRAEGLGVASKPPLSFLAPVPDRAVPTGAMVLLGVTLLLAGYGLWYRHTAHERQLAEAVPAVPAELAPLALPKVQPVLPPAAKPAAAAKAPAPAAAPKMVAATPPAASTGAAPVPAAPPAAASQVASTQPIATPAAAAAPATVPAPPATGQSIVATADSWVEVRDPSGNILFSRVLHAGQSWPVPDLVGLTMTAGNAGATEIADKGKTGAPLGANGAVVRNIPLTPAAPVASAGPVKAN